MTSSRSPAVCELCSRSTSIHDKWFEFRLRFRISPFLGPLTDFGGGFDSIVYRHVSLIRRLPLELFLRCQQSMPLAVHRELVHFLCLCATFYEEVAIYFDRAASQLGLLKETDFRFFCGSTCAECGRIEPGWLKSQRRLPSSPPSIASFSAIRDYLQSSSAWPHTPRVSYGKSVLPSETLVGRSTNRY